MGRFNLRQGNDTLGERHAVLRPAVPQDWPFVQWGLRQIKRRCGEGNWKDEDVYRLVNEGKAGLFVCDDGFVVLEGLAEPLSNRRYLNVWLAWFKPQLAKRKRKELIAWLDEKAREIGAEWWEFRSPRRGWALIEPECEMQSIVWRRKCVG